MEVQKEQRKSAECVRLVADTLAESAGLDVVEIRHNVYGIVPDISSYLTRNLFSQVLEQIVCVSADEAEHPEHATSIVCSVNWKNIKTTTSDETFTEGDCTFVIEPSYHGSVRITYEDLKQAISTVSERLGADFVLENEGKIDTNLFFNSIDDFLEENRRLICPDTFEAWATYVREQRIPQEAVISVRMMEMLETLKTEEFSHIPIGHIVQMFVNHADSLDAWSVASIASNIEKFYKSPEIGRSFAELYESRCHQKRVDLLRKEQRN